METAHFSARFFRIVRILLISFVAITIGVHVIVFFSPAGVKRIRTDFHERRMGVSRLSPESDHSGFLLNQDEGTAYHQMIRSPLWFTVQSIWSWQLADVALTYSSTTDGNVSLGHVIQYPDIRKDQYYLLNSPLLNGFSWPWIQQQGLVVYQREEKTTSVSEILKNFNEFTRAATLNLKGFDLRSYPALKEWVNHTTKIPVEFQGTHTFLLAPQRGELQLDFTLTHVGRKRPEVIVISEGEQLLFDKIYSLSHGESRITIALDDLPPNLPLSVRVDLDPQDTFRDLRVQSPYVIFPSNVKIIQWAGTESLPVYTMNTNGISALAHKPDGIQDIRVGKKTLSVDREQYTFILGGVAPEVQEMIVKKPFVTLGTETWFTFDRQDLIRYHWFHLPEVRELPSLDHVDVIISSGVYDKEIAQKGTRAIHQTFSTSRDFDKNQKEAVFTIHASTVGDAATLPIRIHRATIRLKKSPWSWATITERTKIFFEGL